VKLAPVTLCGPTVRLEPLGLDHLAGLIPAAADPRIWRYMLYGQLDDPARLRAWIETLLAAQEVGTDLPFAVRHLASGALIGATRYLEILPAHRSLEIGGTWFAPAWWGSGVNRESKFLLLRHAFEDLGMLRVQFKVDRRNERSQQAIVALGAVWEGVLRSHRITPAGERRDSVFYSILAEEWPGVRAALHPDGSLNPDAAPVDGADESLNPDAGPEDGPMKG
jgi:RimJ/RimL family protein N-acetyltransferase